MRSTLPPPCQHLLQLPPRSASEGRIVLVDDQLGRGLPETPADLISVCLRLGIAELRLNKQNLQFDEKTRRLLEDALLIQRGAAVDRIEPLPEGHSLVTFKRYRKPRGLSTELAQLVNELGTHPATIGELRDGTGGFPLLKVFRALEDERIIDLVAPANWTF